MSNPKITVVTVTYNAEQFLEKTIKSVIEQDYPNVEYIIIDGSSKDGTIDIIKQYEKYITYWISESDGGIYDAMNKAIDAATGEWINFMNAGDSFVDSTTLEKFISDLNPQTELYNGAINFIVNENQKVTYRPPNRLDKVWTSMPCWHQASFIKTSLMKKYKYSLEYKIAGDHEFYLRCYNNNHKFQFTHRSIANMAAGGLHQQQEKLAKIESMKIIANYAPNIDLVYQSDFYKTLQHINPINNNYLFSTLFVQFYTQIEEFKKSYKKIALYGYGTIGRTIVSMCKDNIEVIVDQNKIVDDALECPIINLEELRLYSYDAVLISVLGREEEIVKSLLKHNVEISKIKTLKLNHA